MVKPNKSSTCHKSWLSYRHRVKHWVNFFHDYDNIGIPKSASVNNSSIKLKYTLLVIHNTHPSWPSIRLCTKVISHNKTTEQIQERAFISAVCQQKSLKDSSVCAQLVVAVCLVAASTLGCVARWDLQPLKYRAMRASQMMITYVYQYCNNKSVCIGPHIVWVNK